MLLGQAIGTLLVQTRAGESEEGKSGTHHRLPMHHHDGTVQNLDKLQHNGVDRLGPVLVLDHTLIPVLAHLVDGGKALLKGVALVLLVVARAALDLGQDAVLGPAPCQNKILAEPGPYRPTKIEGPEHHNEVAQRVQPVRHDGRRVRVPLDYREEVSQPAVLRPPRRRPLSTRAAVSGAWPGGLGSTLVRIVVGLIPFVELAVREAVAADIFIVVEPFPLAHFVTVGEDGVHNFALARLLLSEQVLVPMHARRRDGHLVQVVRAVVIGGLAEVRVVSNSGT